MTTRDDEADLMLTMPMKTGQKDERVGLLEAVSFPVLTGLPFLPHRFRNTKDRERGHPLGESILKEDPHASSRSTQGILLRRRSAANGADPPPKERLRDRRQWSNLRAFGFTAAQAAALLELPRITLQRLNQQHRAEGPSRWRAALRREGKHKIAAGLKCEGWEVSASTAGPIPSHLKLRGEMCQPLRPGTARQEASPSARLRRPQAKRLTASSGAP